MTDPTNERADWRTMEAGEQLDILIDSTLDEDLAAIVEPDYLVYLWRSGQIRRYSTDLNAAFTLIAPFSCFSLGFLDGAWIADINSISSRLRDHGDGSAPTPALAVCRARLDWQERQEA